MILPLQITFRDIPPSEAIEAKIRERAAKLDRFGERIMGCHVVVEAPHRHQKKGFLYNVSIDLTLPGREIVVNREPSARTSHQDVYVAIRDAFNAAARQLEDVTRRMRGDIKSHEVPPHGRVIRVSPLDGYGFIETPDGLEVYFHENALVGADLASLTVGSEVRFSLAEGEGEKGPQASTVEPIGKHHPVP